MSSKRIKAGPLGLSLAALTGLAILAFAGQASAHTGVWARFNNCPSTTTGVVKCVQSVTSGGKVVLGKKTVPIVNPVTLQGGLGEAEFNEEKEAFYEKFYGASNGETLTKVAQPVPGGLTGLVNCKEISALWLRISCEAVFENGLTGVNSTLELARPANQIIVSEENLAFQGPVALQLPVKVHLENPLLGSSCYIGSSTSPLLWNLTTGTTSPPAGTASISGSAGNLVLSEGGSLAEYQGVKLVDNAWSAPEATGCGGWPAEYILDPIINSSVGVPSAAGKNAAIQEKTLISLGGVKAVNSH
jgi:hypothetical protein